LELEFNAHQQQVFCVFSGIGVSQLRNCLNTDMLAEDQEHPLGPVGRAPPDGVEQVAGMMAQGATIIGDDGEDFDETIGEVSDTGIDS
jgi:F-box and leucine-rich repeat protein GRR1